MDVYEIGKLIRKLRREQNLTQKQLAQKIHVSEQAVSKWECGKGVPDISLIKEISQLFEVSMDCFFNGSLETKSKDKGNIKDIQFYVCPKCGNILTSMSYVDMHCCGYTLHPLEKLVDDDHKLDINIVEHDYFVSMEHDMKKEHYISFVAFVSYDRMQFIKLYPEQPMEIRFPYTGSGEVYAYCSVHGLFSTSIKK
ncbi:MAG: helix-turn-helix domain-containing protein [Longicatena sp.]